MGRRTKIVVTIGPASQDAENIANLLQAGMDVARLNFSHGSYQVHAQVYQLLRKTSQELNIPIAIFQDLQGPKIRTGEIEGGQVNLQRNQKLILTTEELTGNAKIVSVDFSGLPQSVHVGSRILIDDGNLELIVTAIHGNQVETRVILSGILKPHKGVNLPGANLDVPGFTAKDAADLEFGLQLGVDAVAISFVRTAADITRVRQAIQQSPHGDPRTPLIAKLERPEALDNLDEIVAEADGVMVARGDLGVEMAPEAVPIAQKRIIDSANHRGKMVITATQMLDSMIVNPRPTRAEASDVANAIFDGSDAVMLSGETAVGKYPIESVRMMGAIIETAEKHLPEWGHWGGEIDTPSNGDDTFYVARATHELAHDTNVVAIAAFTQSGHTALFLSKTRPDVPIRAFTPNVNTYQRLNFYWGVSAHLVTFVESMDDMIQAVEQSMLETGLVNYGQQVIVTCGYPILNHHATNLALLHTIRKPN